MKWPDRFKTSLRSEIHHSFNTFKKKEDLRTRTNGFDDN